MVLLLLSYKTLPTRARFLSLLRLCWRLTLLLSQSLRNKQTRRAPKTICQNTHTRDSMPSFIVQSSHKWSSLFAVLCCVYISPARLSVHHVCAVPLQVRSGHGFPWMWSYRWLLAMRVMKIEPKPLERQPVLSAKLSLWPQLNYLLSTPGICDTGSKPWK